MNRHPPHVEVIRGVEADGILELTAPAPEQRAVARMVRANEVCSRTGLSRTTIWRLVRKGEFPPPRRLSSNAVGWIEEEVDGWIRGRAACV